jgi:hypothetical protein
MEHASRSGGERRVSHTGIEPVLGDAGGGSDGFVRVLMALFERIPDLSQTCWPHLGLLSRFALLILRACNKTSET